MLCSGFFLGPEDVESDSQGNDAANDDLLPEGGHVENVETITNDGQKNSANERTARLSRTSRQGGATNDDGGDGIQLISQTRLRLSRGQSTSQNQASQTSEQTGESVDGDEDATHRDTGESGDRMNQHTTPARANMMTGTGIGPRSAPRWFTAPEVATGVPPDMTRVRPRATLIMASVAMKAGSFP